MLETRLYGPVKDFLESAGFEVLAEVPIKQSTRVVDVVGINDLTGQSVAVELKLIFNKKLIQQAQFNAGQFTFSYLAVPAGVKWQQVPESVGVIEVDVIKQEAYEVQTPRSQAFLPTLAQLKERLFINNINKIIRGGVQSSKATSAKSIVEAKIINLITQKGPLPLAQVVLEISSHYKQPTKGIKELIKQSTQLVLQQEKGQEIIFLRG